MIDFYYQINASNMHYVKGVYYFTYNHDSYVFVPFDKNVSLLSFLYSLNQMLILQNSYYDQMILNKDGLPYIFVDQSCYCLLKSSRVIQDSISFYDLRFDVVPTATIRPLIRFPWTSVWIQRIDYLEEMLHHLEKTSQDVLPIFLYYMGMGENAISYVLKVLSSSSKQERERFVVAHHRIDSRMSVSSLYSPLDLVLDYPCRDVSEYLKSLFYHDEYDLVEVEEYLLGLDFSLFQYSLLYGRMLYASFFFDLVDDILMGKREMREMIFLGEREEEYRIYLKEIYYIISKKFPIDSVRWILRN